MDAELLKAFLLSAKEGGLVVALLIAIVGYVWEVRRGIVRDRANEAYRTKMIDAISEMKTAVSNGNLLLEMLTRGRK